MPKKTQQTVAEIQEKIKILKSIGEAERVKELEEELAALASEPQLKSEEVQTMPGETTEPMADEFVLDGVSQEEYEKATSKFAAVGKHLSEAGAIYWKTPNQSIAIPFTIVEEGPDNGKEGEIICGVSAKAIWKLKQTLEALGVEIGIKNVNGVKRPMFDANQIPGKQFLSLWEEQIDSRSPEEGGKGAKYSKPTTAISLSAVDASVL